MEKFKKIKEARFRDLFKGQANSYNKIWLKSIQNKNDVYDKYDVDDYREMWENIKDLNDEIGSLEKPYRSRLEKLAVYIVKKNYPIVDYGNIDIDAKIVDFGEIGVDIEEPELKIEKEPENQYLDKRRFINSITQGASVRGGNAFKLFAPQIDKVAPGLKDKYNELIEKTFGIYDDDNFINYLMDRVSITGNVKAQGEEEVEYDEETGRWTIKARAINFALLVHEIVKGLYEIIATFGFTADKKKNDDAVKFVDKIENEPEDLRFGKYIYDNIMELFINSEYDDSRIRELLLKGLAEELEDEEFISFMQNAAGNKFTPQQIKKANEIMRNANEMLKRDDAGEDEYNPEDLFEKQRIQKLAGLKSEIKLSGNNPFTKEEVRSILIRNNALLNDHMQQSEDGMYVESGGEEWMDVLAEITNKDPYTEEFTKEDELIIEDFQEMMDKIGIEFV